MNTVTWSSEILNNTRALKKMSLHEGAVRLKEMITSFSLSASEKKATSQVFTKVKREPLEYWT